MSIHDPDPAAPRPEARLAEIELDARLTSRLIVSLQKAATGSLRSFVAAHGSTLSEDRLTSAGKRVAGALWGLLKTHPDVRQHAGPFRDEFPAKLNACEAECSVKAKRIIELDATVRALEERIGAVAQYAQHLPACRQNSWLNEGCCTCGLDAILRPPPHEPT